MSSTNHDFQRPKAEERFWKILKTLGPGLPIFLAVAFSLFTPFDMVWGVVIGIIILAFLRERMYRPRGKS